MKLLFLQSAMFCDHFLNAIFLFAKFWSLVVFFRNMQGLWNLIGKGQGPGRDFNYEVSDVIQGCDGKSVWTIHSGKSKVRNA